MVLSTHRNLSQEMWLAKGLATKTQHKLLAQPVVVTLVLLQCTNRQAIMYHLDLYLFRVQWTLHLQSVVFMVAKHQTLYLHKLNNKDKAKDKHHRHVNR